MSNNVDTCFWIHHSTYAQYQIDLGIQRQCFFCSLNDQQGPKWEGAIVSFQKTHNQLQAKRYTSRAACHVGLARLCCTVLSYQCNIMYESEKFDTWCMKVNFLDNFMYQQCNLLFKICEGRWGLGVGPGIELSLMPITKLWWPTTDSFGQEQPSPKLALVSSTQHRFCYPCS